MREDPIPTLPLPKWGLRQATQPSWASVSSVEMVSMLRSVVLNLKCNNVLKDSSLEPHVHWWAASPWFLSVSNKNTKSGTLRSQMPAPKSRTSKQCTNERLAQQVLKSLPGFKPRNPLSLQEPEGPHTPAAAGDGGCFASQPHWREAAPGQSEAQDMHSGDI